MWPRALLVAAISAGLTGGAPAMAPGSLSGAAQATQARTCQARPGEVHVPSGAVLLGEDGPAEAGEALKVPEFWIDRHEVTNRQFAKFIGDTGYITEAERAGAGAVFQAPSRVAGLDAAQWWRLVRGASWRHPLGPGSQIAGRMDDPVVQVTFADAQAYARWAGRALPSLTQWERAARATQTSQAPPSSWAYSPDGKPVANTWQGVFPVRDTGEDKFEGIAPVGCFAPNALGLHDMIGNVWEWTTESSEAAPGRVVKGGSFLCSFDYCANFRPAGWQAQEADLPTSHIGFRTVRLTPRPAAAAESD